MNQETLQFVTEKSRELIHAATCSEEAKEAAQAWLQAVGTDRQAEQSRLYVQELEEDVVPIDDLIHFAGSDAGKQYFGAEASDGIVAHARQIKAEGAVYCDCPACSVAAAILSRRDELLK